MSKFSNYCLIVLILIFGQFSFGQTYVGSEAIQLYTLVRTQQVEMDTSSGSPQLSKIASNKPVPTNDWWSKLVKEDHADNLFNLSHDAKDN